MSDFATLREAMVDRQVRPSDVTAFPIIEAMLHVPRERFAPDALRDVAYLGEHLALAPGRVTLDPRVFAKMLDAAEIGPDDLVLDLAPGLGYSSAVIARMAAAVVAVEPDAEMAAKAAETLSALEIDNVVMLEGDPAGGDPAHGPYDAVFVNGAVEALPEALTDQLKEGGRLVAIRMDGAHGRAEAVIRSGGRLTPRHVFDASAPVLPGFAADARFVF